MKKRVCYVVHLITNKARYHKKCTGVFTDRLEAQLFMKDAAQKIASLYDNGEYEMEDNGSVVNVGNKIVCRMEVSKSDLFCK